MNKGIMFIIFIVFLAFGSQGFQKEEVSVEESYDVIPDEAIRLRILANSDDEKDQQIKRMVRDEVNAYITEIVAHIDSITEARATIDENVPEIKKIVQQTLSDAGESQSFTVEYRSNVTFPMKIYDNYVYPAGEYEAVLITIGKGEGSNWWCVLFPPLCFLDFSNGSTVAQSDLEEGVFEEGDDESLTSKHEQMDDELEEESEDEDSEAEDSEAEDMEVKFFLFEWLGLS